MSHLQIKEIKNGIILTNDGTIYLDQNTDILKGKVKSFSIFNDSICCVTKDAKLFCGKITILKKKSDSLTTFKELEKEKIKDAQVGYNEIFVLTTDGKIFTGKETLEQFVNKDIGIVKKMAVGTNNVAFVNSKEQIWIIGYFKNNYSHYQGDFKKDSKNPELILTQGTIIEINAIPNHFVWLVSNKNSRNLLSGNLIIFYPIRYS